VTGTRGFTLLELLVALAVFAILSVTAYGGLRSVLFTAAAITAETQRLAQVQMAFFRLEQDLGQTVARPIRDEFGLEQPALLSGELRDELLMLTRTGWDNPLRQARASLQRLAYRLADGQLRRLQWGTLDRVDPAEPRETVLLEQVEDTRFRFLDQKNQWQTRWPPLEQDGTTAGTRLPRAVEIRVTLRDWGEVVRLFLVAGG
jgi:general secretion pathway protein J